MARVNVHVDGRTIPCEWRDTTQTLMAELPDPEAVKAGFTDETTLQRVRPNGPALHQNIWAQAVSLLRAQGLLGDMPRQPGEQPLQPPPGQSRITDDEDIPYRPDGLVQDDEEDEEGADSVEHIPPPTLAQWRNRRPASTTPTTQRSPDALIAAYRTAMGQFTGLIRLAAKDEELAQQMLDGLMQACDDEYVRYRGDA